MSTPLHDLGIVGLGVMGANLALNVAEKGFHVAVYNRTAAKTHAFIAAHRDEPFASNLHGYDTIEAFVAALAPPRKVFLLVQAGDATTATIEQLKTVLAPNDIIIDTGNAHFKDQDKRARELEAAHLRFLGMGISGGEEGARKGPAFFPGGTPSTWQDIKPIVEAAAAKAAEDGRPCVTFNGRGGAGTCVKMYHNAGEYAILQIWAEVYSALLALGLTADEVADVLVSWRARGFLRSYMLDITIAACRAREPPGGTHLIDKVKDRIGSKGTGLWSVQEALEVGVPAPSLDAAVLARQMTMYKDERIANAARVPRFPRGDGLASRCGGGVAAAADTTPGKSESAAPACATEVQQLYHATCLAIIASYAQMFQCLRELDKVYGFGLNLPATIATFRAGCILQGYLLEPMTRAFEREPNLSNLLCAFDEQIVAGLDAYRHIMATLLRHTSVALPVLSASLVYINAMFTPLLPYGQLVSLQRDVFGRHGFERLDRDGKDSFTWPPMQ